MSSESGVSSPAASKSTGELKAPTGPLRAGVAQPDAGTMGPRPRGFAVRLAELLILLCAIVGALALGLGLSDYLASHRYVAGYLLAYFVFRLADLLIREEAALGLNRECFARRMINEVPLLLLFFAAPFERTYVYGGEAPHWVAATGLLIELIGLWLALGARIQLGFFSVAPEVGDTLVRGGLYYFIRHPIYAGEFIVLFAWPFIYGAPITLVVASIIGFAVMQRRIEEEEAALLAHFGDEYASYMQVTDRFLPNVW
jgi:protein-S-isoprenylcysteine O-methyltransferase Ste14